LKKIVQIFFDIIILIQKNIVNSTVKALKFPEIDSHNDCFLPRDAL